MGPAAPARLPVLLCAAVAIPVFGTGGLWHSWVRAVVVEELGTSAAAFGVYQTMVFTPFLLGLLWAHLSDRLPVLGRRREGYLILAGLLAAVVWAAITFVPRRYGVWLAAALALGTATALARGALLGALAELAQRQRATSRLAAAHLGLSEIAALAIMGLGDLVLDSLGQTAVLGGTVAMSLVFMALLLPDRSTEAPQGAELSPEPLRGWLRSRAFWAAALVMACASIPRALYNVLDMNLRGPMRPSDEVATLGYAASLAAGVVAAACYTLAGSRIPGRRLWPLALVIEGLALLGLLALGQSPASSILPRAAAGFGTGFASCARLDLLFRVVPRGHEALGVTFLLAVTPVMTIFTGATTFTIAGPRFPELVLPLAAAAMASALAVLVVPRAIASGRDGPGYSSTSVA